MDFLSNFQRQAKSSFLVKIICRQIYLHSFPKISFKIFRAFLGGETCAIITTPKVKAENSGSCLLQCGLENVGGDHFALPTLQRWGWLDGIRKLLLLSETQQSAKIKAATSSSQNEPEPEGIILIPRNANTANACLKDRLRRGGVVWVDWGVKMLLRAIVGLVSD